MYAFRLIAVLLLIVVILVAYNPELRASVVETWENIKPAVIEFIDTLYTAIRDLISGNDSNDPLDGTPTPDNPGVNFDRIVTENNGLSL
jgi:hypothetical protein